MNTASQLRATLARALAADPTLVVIGEQSGGVAGVLAGLRTEHGASRVLDLPVADRGAIGVAVGLALGGRRVVVELSSTGRIPAALEALAEAASIAADGEFPVPLTVRIPCGGEAGDRVDRPAAELLRAVGGLRVVCPSSGAQAVALLEAALQAPGPVVILEPRALYPRRAEATAATSLHAASELASGRHLTLVSWGTGVEVAQDAAATLAREGIEAGIVDLVSLSPLDVDTLGRVTTHTGRLVVVHPREGGLADSVIAAALAPSFLYLEAPLATVAAAPAAVLSAARDAVRY